LVKRACPAFAAGAAVAAVSTKAFVAVPQPTESTTTPELSAPNLMASPPAVADKAQLHVVGLYVTFPGTVPS
jgi:hypothetical protein